MMKRLFRLMLAAALGICACNTIDDQTGSLGKISFTASLSQEVKTILVDGTKVFWEYGDRISVSGAQSPFVTSLTEASQVAVFSGEAEASDRYHAVYPFSCVDSWYEDLAFVSLPHAQQAKKGSFDPEANIIAASTEASSMSLQFRNVVGYVKFTVGSQSGNITSVTVSSNAQDVLSGDLLLDCSTLETVPDTESYTSVSLVSGEALEEGTYYIAMLPGTYSEGLTFTFEGPDGTAVKSISAPLTLERGKVNSLGEISSLSWEQEKEQEESYYVEVAQTFDDWSGEYLITYDDGLSITVFDSWSDETFGQSATDLKSKLTADGIPAEDGDAHKAVISKVGEYYSIYVTNVGYIGFTGSSNALYRQTSAPGATDTVYL